MIHHRLDEWPIISHQLPWIVHFFWTRLRTGRLSFAPALYPRRGRDVPPALRAAFLGEEGPRPLDQVDEYYRRVYLPGLLVVEDKVSMAHSLETRVPLWSQELVSWARGIPIGLKVRGGVLKALLRDVAHSLLPPELFDAPKRGFPTPLRLWFRGPLRKFVEDRLLSRDSEVHRIVPRRGVERLLRAHRTVPLPFALDERRAHRIWMLLCLESWTRQFRVRLEEAA